MKDFLHAPFVIPGMILICIGIIGSLFVPRIEDNMLSMLAAFGCCILAFLGASPIMDYFHSKMGS